MLIQMLGASSTRNAFFRALLAFAAILAALYIFSQSLALYATARFWEQWVKSGGSFAIIAPAALIALLSGVVVGISLAAIFRLHAVRVAAVAAFLQIVWAITVWLSDTQSVGRFGFVFPVALAGGLLVGASLVGLVRRA